MLARNNGDSRFPATHPLSGLEEQTDCLRDCGAMFYDRGWSVGTSSNYSLVLRRDPLELLVTASGKDKGRLGREDFVRIDPAGSPVVEGQPKSSAEALLHVVIARQSDVGAVLHTHSVWSTLLSDLYFSDGLVSIEGYEMLKGLSGVSTHEHQAHLQIFENTQNIPSLAEQVANRLEDPEQPLTHGFLIRRHGLYTWGREIDEARRHVEVLEFLLECVARRLMLIAAPQTI